MPDGLSTALAKSRWVRFRVSLLSVAFWSALAVTLASTVFIPIYQDEIGWKLLQARYFQDGGANITMFPQCPASFAVPAPWYMLPDRAIEAALYGDISRPIWLRINGILSLFAWLGFSLWLLTRSRLEALRALPLPTLVLALVSLGVLPYLMVLNRPEQPLLLGLTLLLLLPFVLRPQKGLAAEAALTAGLMVLVVLLVSRHPKTLLFLPLIGASLFLLIRRNALRASAAALLGYVLVTSYQYWTARNQCPNDPLIDAHIKGQLTPPSALLHDPLAAVQRLLGNLLDSWLWLKNMVFWYTYQGKWLPPAEVLPWWVLPTSVAVGLAGAAVVLLAGFNGLRLAAETWQARRPSVRAVMVLACLASLTAMALIQGVKNFYETSLVMPLLILCALVGLPENPSAGTVSLLRRAVPGLLVLSLLSQTALWTILAPHVRTTLRGGLVPSQDYSFSPFNYDRTAQQVAATARRCGIDPDNPPPHLVLDETTYPTLSGSYRPFHVYYVSVKRLAPGGLDEPLERSLARMGSGGAVAACRRLDPPLHPFAVQNGALCCVPAFTDPPAVSSGE